MKTLTKILSVTALIVLCVCLFTLTAFAVTPHAATAATCTDDGNEAYTESDTNKFYRGLYQSQAALEAAVAAGETTAYADASVFTIPATGHPPLTHVAAKAATCYAKGNDEYWFCSKCGKYYSDPSGSATTEVTDPSTLFTDPKDHTTLTWIHFNEVKPNCVREGNVEYYKCPECGALSQTDKGAGPFYADVSATILPKTDHNWGAWTVTKPQTNVSPGQEMHECQDCGKVEYREIPADGIDPSETPWDLWYVIMTRDTWLRGEEPLTFESNLVKKLNDESGPNANYVGVRIGTDSLYENSYDTFDFWSWDEYVKLGDKTMAGLREGEYRLWIYDKRHPDVYTCSRPFYVVDVPTLEPYSTDKHVVNSSKSLRFIASEEMRPDSIMVGSRKLYDSNDYFVSNDRKNVTLSPDFLNARQTGTYTISAQTKDGRTIKTNFYILSTAQASSSPRTGDESQIGLWAAFLLLSGAAIVVMVPKLRKHGAK